MRKTYLLLAAAGSLALAACGSTDDASTEAEADTVEMPADAALEGVSETPAADPAANSDETATTEQTANEAADAAADVAAAADAAAAAGDATE